MVSTACPHCDEPTRTRTFRVASDLNPSQALFRHKDPVTLCPKCDAPEDPPTLRFPHPA